MAIQQADRTVMIATPLEENELVLRSFTATERLGRPFQVEAELLSGNFDIKFEDLLGQNVTIRLETASGAPRFFNGFVSRFAQGAPFGRLARYHATIVPWLWFLTRNSDCRIFQAMTIPEIVKQVFRDRGFNDFDDALTGSYRTWEYCVQYRETDFNFVNRLMEQEGIYYFFVHEDGKHRLVLADGPDSHEALAGSPEIPFRRSDRGSVVDDRECVDDWSVSKELQPGNYSLESFDFKVPGKELRTAAAIIREHAGSGFEMFDYPNDYVEPADGEKYAMMREQELQAQYEVSQAHGDCRDVCAGFTFALTEFPREDQNREYLITSAQYHVTSDAFDVGGNGGGGRGGSRPYACGFTALEAKTQFRPPRITPKPIIQGPQTAIIVGPAGQEIHLDPFGRVKVQFHWDRHGQYDENSSCWVRVSQGWAGKQWGIVFNPRIGQEVIVDFLEGDPDQPIITGRVYNGANLPPYAVPANGTHSGIKSRSSKGGTPNNFNEIRMEDTKGSELFYIQAEKDWKIHVKKNETENVGGSLSTSVGGAISRSSGGSHSRTAGDSITDKAKNTYTLNTGKGQSLKAGGSYQLLTNEGIHLKTINFVMELIEAGIEGAMAALKGDAGEAASAAKDFYKGDNKGVDALGSKIAGQMSTAFGPAIGAASGELTRMCTGAEAGYAKSSKQAEAAGEAAGKFAEAVQGGAGNEAIATAFVGMAVAAYEAYADAKKLIDGLLPKIPSIVMWAMKDIQGQALWNISFESKFRDISLETKTRDISVKGKKNVNVEAVKKDLNLKASAKDVNMTAKKKMSIKTEEDNLVIDCGKNMTVKVKKKLQLKCGDASITLLDGGEILIRGKEIKINATSGPTTVLGTPIKLN